MYRAQRQSGFALVIGLVILLIMTIIVVTSLRTTALEARMAGNLSNYNIAFQAAESALREAEGLIELNTAHSYDSDVHNPVHFSWDGDDSADNPNPFFKINNNSGFGVDDCAYGLCDLKDSYSVLIDALEDGDGRTAATGISGIAAEPQFLIEALPMGSGDEVVVGEGYMRLRSFRITVRAWGQDANTRVFLQSTYTTRVRQETSVI